MNNAVHGTVCNELVGEMRCRGELESRGGDAKLAHCPVSEVL